MPNKEEILRILTTKVVGNKDLVAKDQKIEQFLGLKSEEYEQQAIAENPQNLETQELYLDNLPALALNTSWHDIYQLLTYISSKQEKPIVCDLGAGNCRIAIMAELFFPNIKVISIEPVFQRMHRAQEICHGSHHEFYPNYFEDIYSKLKFDFVFLYFPNGNIFEGIFQKLKSINFNYSILCVESHGEMVNRLNFEKSWLQGSEVLKLIAPRHREYIYEFKKVERAETSIQKKFHELFHHRGEYKVLDKNGYWYASSTNMNIYFDKPDTLSIEFKFPPRTLEICESNLNEILVCNDHEIQDQREFLEYRNKGKVRKVYESDLLELPDGKLIKKGQL